jgi:hypothetical protein
VSVRLAPARRVLDADTPRRVSGERLGIPVGEDDPSNTLSASKELALLVGTKRALPTATAARSLESDSLK